MKEMSLAGIRRLGRLDPPTSGQTAICKECSQAFDVNDALRRAINLSKYSATSRFVIFEGPCMDCKHSDPRERSLPSGVRTAKDHIFRDDETGLPQLAVGSPVPGLDEDYNSFLERKKLELNDLPRPERKEEIQ